MTVPQQISEKFSLTVGRVSQLKKAGAPTSSLALFEEWYYANVTGNRRARRSVSAAEAPTDCDAESRVTQAHAMVAKNHALWLGAAEAGQVREACELQKAYSLSCKDASFAEQEFVEWQRRMGTLMDKTAILAAFDASFDSCLKRLHRDYPDAGKLVEDACQIFSAKLNNR
jgi:hypothetical protein